MAGMSTDSILTLLQDVAAEIITPRFRALQRHEIADKGSGSLVTVADHEAEVAITEALSAAYPDAVILGEEAHAGDESLMARYLRADHAFTVDPVDGTRNFVDGNPDHAVMVAETIGGETSRAWIWQPEHRAAWVAERGRGTWRNGEPVRRPPVAPGTAPHGATGIWRLRKKTLNGLGPLRWSWQCCGVDYPKLVEGAVDFIVYRRTHPWDHVPGTLIVREAGGWAGGVDGMPYTPRTLTPGLVVAADARTYELAAREVRTRLS